MIRLLFRLLGQLVLALALVFAVADIARSIANDAVSLTPLGTALAALGIVPVPVAGAVDVMALVAEWPASVALMVLAFLLLFLGRRPHRVPGRLAR